MNRSCDDSQILWGALQPGTILIEEGALVPESLQAEDAPGVEGWRSVEPADRRQLERNIREAGSIFYFKTEEITATAFGFDQQKAVRVALQRIIASVRLQKCNCLQISEVIAKSFLRILYVSVSAHLRHIQGCPGMADDRQRRSLAEAATAAGT